MRVRQRRHFGQRRENVDMEWWAILLIIAGLLLAFFASGIPVAFAFLGLNIIGFAVWAGGLRGLELLVPSAYDSVATFTWVAVPLFIFMGQMLFQTGLGRLLIDQSAKWVGGIPGSLSLVAIGSGTLFAMMSGSGISGVALFGSTLAPEMSLRGYSKQMIYGPLLAAGGLAVIIPPSTLAVIVATLSVQSVGDLLIGGVIPGFILAGFYVAYILVRGHLQPHLCPTFAPPHITWGDRIKALALIAPLGSIIFLVLGLIFLGVATPSEAAALGATGTLVLAAAYRRLTWQAIKETLWATTTVTVMVFVILLSATAFGQLLAYTGVSRELSTLVTSLPVPPIVIIIAIQITLVIMGMFMESVPMVMITIPIFFPIVRALGFDPVWFGVLMVVNMELAAMSPPFGLYLFTLKGVLPDATMADIYRAVVPMCLIVLVLVIALLIFPSLVTWLPGLMLK
ncbi:MAG: TRAP transporter large permease subunit [Chloroflexi bacterium]|nr:TRAP transporter large permease subunit [Chloroflexota bacterium]